MSATVQRRRVVCSFGGGGGGAAGFQQARVELHGNTSEFELVGGFDKDEYACKVFEYLTGVSQVCIDARELTPGLMREFYGEEAPFVVFGSPPCQGASRLLSTAKSKAAKYEQLNELTLINTRLILDTWPDDKPSFILYENVPNITSRARKMLTEVRRLLKTAGYVLQDGFHECRHVGNLAQRRKRWFLVARNPAKVPAFLYLPPHRPGKVCGDVLNELPMPGDPTGGPMHELPAISAMNWWRLWAIHAGGDWRDLLPDDGTPRRKRFRRHHVEQWTEPSVTIGGTGSNGPCGVADPRPGPARRFHHVDRVAGWNDATGTVTHAPAPSSGAISVADPLDMQPQHGNGGLHYDKYTVRPWNREALTVHGATRVGSGAQSIALPLAMKDSKFHEGSGIGRLGVLAKGDTASTVIANARIATGPFSYAAPVPLAPLDLVPEKACFDKGYAVIDRDREPSLAIAGTSSVGCGTYSITDKVPTPLDLTLGCSPHADACGVIDEVAPTVIAATKIDNSTAAIADRKPPAPPFVVLSHAQAKLVADGYITAPFAIVDPGRPDEPLAIVDDMQKPPFRWVERRDRGGKITRRKVIVPLVLISADGAWHRPLTTLELAVLQGLPWRHKGAPLDLGEGSTKQRRCIGNMVPMPVGMEIADQMLRAGLAADHGCFFLYGGGGGLWVKPDHRDVLVRAGIRAVRPQDLDKVDAAEMIILDDDALRIRSRRCGALATRSAETVCATPAQALADLVQ